MREFFKDTKTIILGVVGVIGILVSIGFNIKDAIEVGQMGLPTPAWTAIGLIVFFVCFFALLYLWRKHMLLYQSTTQATDMNMSDATQNKKKQSKGLGVYTNRANLRNERGELSNELKGHERVWAIWHECRIATLKQEVQKCNIEKVILTHPLDNYMIAHFVNMAIDKPLTINDMKQEIRLKTNEIKHTAKHIKGTGAEVRYYKGPISCTLILADTMRLEGNKFSEKAWARIETGIPFQDTDNRPNIVIMNQYQPELFEVLRKHFDLIWDKSISINE